MPTRGVRAGLEDILEAVDGIQALPGGVPYAQFLTAWHLQRATERGLEIISEASRSIPEGMKMLEPDVPWREIAGIGNLLRHEYQRVEPLIIWNIVEQHMDRLAIAVRHLLGELEDEDKG
jgi:uncharacterized protein with HEPN domain